MTEHFGESQEYVHNDKKTDYGLVIGKNLEYTRIEGDFDKIIGK